MYRNSIWIVMRVGEMSEIRASSMQTTKIEKRINCKKSIISVYTLG